VLPERILERLSDAGVESVKYEKVVPDRKEVVPGFLDDFKPEIVVLPSPVEDKEAFVLFTDIPGLDRVEKILLYELRSLLMPNLVVDVTHLISFKEERFGDKEVIDLSLALNQYRSVTNMRGRGFAEAFFSVSIDELKRGKRTGWASIRDLDNTPLPFFKGFELLSENDIHWFDGEGKNENVLILSPHYDDESIGCAGTINRHMRRGDHIVVLFMTDGSEGDPREENRELVSTIRKREAREAANDLGVKKLEFLNHPETMLKPGSPLKTKMRKIIKDIDPDVIYLPSFLENHVDHMELNRILYSLLKGRENGPIIRFFGLWTMIPANFLVDISEEYEEKVRAVNRYRSQITQVDYLSAVMSINRYWSVKYGDGKGYLEIYYSVGSAEYCSLIETLGLDREMFN
jgi:LmbE family N-acetylglucosaminyl deacetylase